MIFSLIVSSIVFSGNLHAQPRGGEFQVWVDQTESVRLQSLDQGFAFALKRLPVVLRRFRPARIVVYGFTDNAALAEEIGAVSISYPPDPTCRSVETILRNKRDRAAAECEANRNSYDRALSDAIDSVIPALQALFRKASLRRPGCTNIGSVIHRLSITPGILNDKAGQVERNDGGISGAWVMTDGRSTCGSRSIPKGDKKIVLVLIPPVTGRGEKTADDLFQDAEVAARGLFPGVHIAAPYQLTGAEF